MLLASPSSVVKVVQLPDVDVAPGEGVGVGVGDGEGVGGGISVVGVCVDVHPAKTVTRTSVSPTLINNNHFFFMITSFWLKALFIA